MTEVSIEAISGLLALGRFEAAKSIPDELFTSLRDLDHLNRLHWSQWNAVTQNLVTADVVSLFRGMVIAEKHFGWLGGSVAGAIWIFQEISRRDTATADSVCGWALDHTRNGYVPFGGSSYGARTLAEYRELSASRMLERQKRDSEVADEERKSKEHHAIRSQQRRRAAELRKTPLRKSFIEALAPLPIRQQLQQLSCDQQFPVEWYPVKLAGAATKQVILELEYDLRMALLEKLRGTRRGPWSAFKSRLLESLNTRIIP